LKGEKYGAQRRRVPLGTGTASKSSGNIHKQQKLLDISKKIYSMLFITAV
jgi:hypothetical protein